MGKWSEYKVKYQIEWELDPELKDWIGADLSDDRRARCRICQLVLPAHHAGLTKHAQSPKHLKLLGQLATSKNSHSPSALGDSADEAEATENSDMSTEKELNEVSCGKVTAAKYQPRWQMDPAVSGWLEPVEQDSSKARCAYCNVLLRAKFKDLERHAVTTKHISNSNIMSSSTGAINTSSSDLSRAAVPLGDILEPQQSYALLSLSGAELNLECEDDMEYLINRVSTRNKHQSVGDVTLSTTAAVITSATAALTSSDDGDLVVTATNKRSLNDSGNDQQGLPAKRHYTKRVPAAAVEFDWRQDPRIKDWASEVPDDGSKVRCRHCQCLLIAKYGLLLRHVASNRHYANTQLSTSIQQNTTNDTMTSANTVMSASVATDSASTDDVIVTDSNIKHIKCELPALDDENAEKLNALINATVANDVNDINDINDDTAFEDDSVIMDGRRKRHSAKGVKWSQYKKAYRREWEDDPMLRGWIAPVPGDRLKAACQYCSCILRAHYSDLRHHFLSTKHSKNAEWYSKTADTPHHREQKFTVQHCAGDNNHVAPPSNTNSRKLSSCYVVGNNRWARYRKRYRRQWEHDPQFQGWIMPVSGDDSRARCRYCRVMLRAHYNDLRTHARTTKHANNVAFGRPCDESLCPNSTSTHSQRGNNGTSRGRKTEHVDDTAQQETFVATLSMCDKQFSLDRPDDTLCSLPTLANITTFGWRAPSSPETTLILQNDLHLDERIAASLPQTPGIRYRVRKEPLPAGCELTVTSGGKKLHKTATGVERIDASSSSTSNTDEVTNEMLSHVARSVTLWEFLMLKVTRGRGVTVGQGSGSEQRVKIAEILTEFAELQNRVKSVAQQILSPVSSASTAGGGGGDGEGDVTAESDVDTAADDIRTLVLDSDDLAHSLGLEPGQYNITTSRLTDSLLADCRPLVAPLRRRGRPQRSNANYLTSAQLVALEPIPATTGGSTEQHRYVIDSSDGTGQHPQYIIEPDNMDQSMLVSGTSGHLVLVADNGELVLQYDPKDYPQLSNLSVEDIKSLVGCSVVDASSIIAEKGPEVGTVTYVTDDHSELVRKVKLQPAAS